MYSTLQIPSQGRGPRAAPRLPPAPPMLPIPTILMTMMPTIWHTWSQGRLGVENPQRVGTSWLVGEII